MTSLNFARIQRFHVITLSHENVTDFEMLKIKADASLNVGHPSCVILRLGGLCYQLPPGILGFAVAIPLVTAVINNDAVQVLYLGLI